jgi:hypothetical protein
MLLTPKRIIDKAALSSAEIIISRKKGTELSGFCV